MVGFFLGRDKGVDHPYSQARAVEYHRYIMPGTALTSPLPLKTTAATAAAAATTVLVGDISILLSGSEFDFTGL